VAFCWSSLCTCRRSEVIRGDLEGNAPDGVAVIEVVPTDLSEMEAAEPDCGRFDV
jgi:hypothetical protein